MSSKDRESWSGKSSQPKRASWRSTSVKPEARAPRSEARGWWKTNQAEQTKRLDYKFKLAAWILLGAGLFGGYLYYILSRYLQVPLVALAVTDYESPLIPPNAWAREDVERFDGLKQVVQPKPKSLFSSPDLDPLLADLRSRLDAAKPGGPDKNVVLVYLSAHGAVNERNEPCLLVPKSNPFDSTTWLPLAEVLKEFKSLPSNTKKVLVLDCTRLRANWSLGVLYNSFADRLAATVNAAQVDGLVVLNSTSPDEIAWAAPEWSGSFFGYFVTRGLAGDADRAKSGNDDGVVSLQELRRYLVSHVDQSVREYRSGRQRPLLLPEERSSQDFALAYVQSESLAEPGATSGRDDPRWDDVHKLWDYEAQYREASYRLDPVNWAWFQNRLLRLEQLLLAGSAYRVDYDRAKRELEEWVRLDRARKSRSTEVAALSLPLMRSLLSPAKAEETQKQSESLRKQWQAAGGPPDEKQVVPSNLSYTAAALGTWQWLTADGSVTPERAAQVLSFVAQTKDRPTADAVEFQFLRMLDGHLDNPADPARFAAMVTLRGLAEQAALPADERAHYWIKTVVSDADARRRHLEDAFFIDARAVQESPSPGESLPEEDYRRAVEQSDKVMRAFAVRDRGWAEVPHLAQWMLTRRLPTTDAQRRELQSLIVALHELAAWLDAPGAVDAPAEVEKLRMNAEAGLKGLTDEFEQDWDRFEGSGSDQETLVNAEALLALPIISGRARLQLRQKHLELLFEDQGAITAAALVEKDSTIAPEADVEKLFDWGVHPALNLLSRTYLSDDPQATRPGQTGQDDKERSRAEQLQSLAEQGGKVRALLASLPEAAATYARETRARLESEEGTKTDPVKSRLGRSKADRLARAAAAFSGPWNAEDLATELREMDLHHVMIWQCRRTLTDFWGPSDAPYFDVAASEYLDSARRLLSAAKDAQALEAERNKLRQAAANFLTAQAAGVRLIKGKQIVDHALSIGESKGVPPGTAAVYLRLAGQLYPVKTFDEMAELRRMPWTVQDPAGSLTYRLPIDRRLEKPNARLEAVLFYRGHEKLLGISVVPPGGLEIEYQQPELPQPTITVRGDLRRTSALVFVLDCSGSMFAQVSREARGVNRLDVARGTLKAILSRLRDMPFDVGIRFYGHRSGWGDDMRKSIVPSDYAKDAKRLKRNRGWDIDQAGQLKGLHPSEDVERVFTITRLTEEKRRQIDAVLDQLDPWGETPLYLSIVEAVNDFNEVDRAATRHIIVITDGFNEQSPGGPLNRITYEANVEAALLKQNTPRIRLDIVSFDLDAKTPKERSDLAFLNRITKSTGGQVHSANDPSSLLRALEKSLGLGEYVVTPAGQNDNPQAAERLKLNESWTFPGRLPSKRRFNVAVQGVDVPAQAQVELAGGEALELFYEPSADRPDRPLVHHRYDGEERAFQEVVAPPGSGGPEKLWIGAHIPVRSVPNNVNFYISVQNGDPTRFSPRPAEAWVEITPLLPGDAKGQKYTFYDLMLEPRKPVPVIKCQAPEWPLGSERAQIELWCKYAKTKPDLVKPVRQLKDQRLKLDGVALEVETAEGDADQGEVQVMVFESGENAGTIKVEMNPEPKRVVHRYSTDGGIVQHSFYYDNIASEQALDYEVRLTTRESLQSGAIRLSKPLERIVSK